MKTLGFIGMGNMAGAIAAGILQKGLMKKEEVFAYAPHYEKLEANAEKIGFVPCKDLKGLTAKADTLVMACKPYQIEGVLSEIKEELKGKALISIAAGWNYDKYEKYLDKSTRLQFIMPNTPAMDAPRISAKEGINIGEVMERIVTDIPAPKGDPNAPLKALIFDSYYDAYKGVVIYIRVKEGTVKVGDTIRLMATGAEFTIVEAGYMDTKRLVNVGQLSAGEVGYLSASIKSIGDTQVGDTVTLADNPCAEPLPGYRKVNPMVFSGIYPADGAKYGDLREALEKLQLNDASLSFEPETSIALGFGFRCGFLGLLHMEIIQERLEREYNLDLITTAPSVIYRVTMTNGDVEMIDNPTNYPDPALIQLAEEPMVKAEILTPPDYVGNVMELCQNRRGVFLDMQYLDDTRVSLKYHLPLNEIVYDFFDVLKSRTKGYASFDYEVTGYAASQLVKLDILLNGDVIDALSFIIHKDKAYERARKIVEKLKENIPRQLFEVPVQAAIGGKIIARETIKAMRKDVLAKCYGGDITRKKKLLEKQKEGKKRMRQLGTVEVPQEAFMSVLKLDEE